MNQNIWFFLLLLVDCTATRNATAQPAARNLMGLDLGIRSSPVWIIAMMMGHRLTTDNRAPAPWNDTDVAGRSVAGAVFGGVGVYVTWLSILEKPICIWMASPVLLKAYWKPKENKCQSFVNQGIWPPSFFRIKCTSTRDACTAPAACYLFC